MDTKEEGHGMSQEQELQRPRVLRVNKEDFIHSLLSETFDTSKLAGFTHYVSKSSDMYGSTYQQLNHHETDALMFLEYENPNGTLELEISFEISDEYVLFFTHEAYLHIQKADGWFRISQYCQFKENPCLS